MYQFAGRFNRKTDLQDTAPHLGDKLLISGNIALGKELHSCACDEYEIFCFGTIYNLEDLKARFNIRTEHHCKAIHDLFILKGNHWSTLADGEFTVIMQNDEEFFIWRDRHGTGPQVYYNDEVFASHPFMLREFKDFSSEPDWESIATFMGLGYIPSPQTALKNVRKLPAGQSLHWRNGSISTHYLYSFEKFLEKTNTFKGSEDEATEIYKELHIKAIHSRTRQSKSVGLLLSGGYDSGGNIYALRQSYAGSAQSVSIGFKDNPWTEVPLARIMSDRFETHFTSYEITGSELEDLPLIVKQLGDPFQEGGLMVNYMAMKMATGFSADVILGGDGNDQHFGTSGKEFALHWPLHTRGMS